MKIKILSQNYLMYSCVIFGPIVLFAMMLMFILAEGDFILLLYLTMFCIISVSLLSIMGYFRLKKNIHLHKVVLEEQGLKIDDVLYHADQIEQITSIGLRNAINKYNLYLIEIKMSNGEYHYFLDRPMSWTFKSPSIRLLKKHTLLSSKVNNKEIEKDGFSSLYQ
ncbi:hypothetical protein [Empedobacter brevis]|uniref:hypothetical protein n=1 Tax=Empedobacter brevis TaxID=247 RepID=UPI00131FA1A8|nr:hypothetical protein [Empedobacter brevis]QHC86462.1 hypothetical protein AS589_17605 [Empedobacter brevis]